MFYRTSVSIRVKGCQDPPVKGEGNILSQRWNVLSYLPGHLGVYRCQTNHWIVISRGVAYHLTIRGSVFAEAIVKTASLGVGGIPGEAGSFDKADVADTWQEYLCRYIIAQAVIYMRLTLFPSET